MIKMILNLNPELPDKYIYIKNFYLKFNLNLKFYFKIKKIYIFKILSTIYKRGLHPLESEWRMKIMSYHYNNIKCLIALTIF